MPDMPPSEPLTEAPAPGAPPAHLALFPLNAVLFPAGPLPLRIFETRYTDMIRRCLREQSRFGVVMIRAGGEVGEVTSTADVGTSARIVDFYQLPDGLLGVTCLGERKFRVLRRWLAPDQLNIAEVEWLAPESEVAVPPEHRGLALLLEKLLPELGELYANVPHRLDEAGWVGSRLAEVLPFALAHKQHWLEVSDPLARLAEIAPLIRRVEP
jgi:uncharacterized protein